VIVDAVSIGLCEAACAFCGGGSSSRRRHRGLFSQVYLTASV
jgi:hypothetical protein